MIDFLIINPDLSSFNMQGLEKLNDFTKKYYFSLTNRKKTKSKKETDMSISNH